MPDNARKSESDITQLSVNGKLMQIDGVSTNSLTRAACERFNIDSVDMHTTTSSLMEMGIPIIESGTYSLIYFVPDEVQLTAPISAPSCARLKNVDGGKTLIDVFVCAEEEFTRQDLELLLNGVPGCTAVANLGFCLLKSLHDITTRKLSTVTISDRTWVDTYKNAHLKVADAPIFSFCESAGLQNVFGMVTSGDCQNWTACMGMEGDICIHTIPKCI